VQYNATYALWPSVNTGDHSKRAQTQKCFIRIEWVRLVTRSVPFVTFQRINYFYTSSYTGALVAFSFGCRYHACASIAVLTMLRI